MREQSFYQVKKRKNCNGNCKKFKVNKPSKMGRYESGQGRCQICAIWIDHNGCHLKGGAVATAESKGWFCNCCNYQVRRNPRNAYYKTRLRLKIDKKHDDNKNDTDSEYIERINQITAKVIPQIKKEKNIYASDIQVSCNITQSELPDIITKITRIEGMTKKEIHYDDTLSDILLIYDEPLPLQESEPSPVIHDKSSTCVASDIRILEQHMTAEHIANKKRIDKPLQRRLTFEYIDVKSMKKVIQNHPELSKTKIMRHIRTPLRLPDELRTLNRAGLHVDPEYSLQIALFSVNYHDWDGQKDTQDDVTSMAVAISKHVASSAYMEAPVGESRHGREMVRPSDETVTVAIAVWVATATLHKEHGMDEFFPNSDIIDQVFGQKLCRAFRKTVSDHVAGHCVANAPTTTSATHRKIYRVRPGMYRLYKRGDDYHITRERCKSAPMKFELPEKYQELRKWYDEEYCKT